MPEIQIPDNQAQHDVVLIENCPDLLQPMCGYKNPIIGIEAI